MTTVCVIGGGINGAGIAWELVRRGYRVTLYEKGSFGGATSSATTKMIHGGLRYLETGGISLVRESLRERSFLLEALPDLVHPLPIAIPIYDDSPRPAWMVRVGLVVYDLLAGRRRLQRSSRLTAQELAATNGLRADGLVKGFLYWDAQVDDGALVRRVVSCAVRDGLDARERDGVNGIRRTQSGWEVTSGSTPDGRAFDLLVNAVGPWMNEHLARFDLPSEWRLTLIRGSHLILRRPAPPQGTLIQAADGRVVFVLPWKGQVLAGTTEVPHTSSLDRVAATQAEIEYLLDGYNRYFSDRVTEDDIDHTFSGVRPLIESKANPSLISREARVETGDAMIHIFGGKLTTFLSLARSAGDAVDRVAGIRTKAVPPRF